MEANTKELLGRAMSGDVLAMREIVKLQQQGRALRLYPHGRKGPLDEGVMPVIYTRNPETGLLRIEKGRLCPLEFKFDKVAWFIHHQIYLCGLLYLDYSDHENPLWEIESMVRHDHKHAIWIKGDSIWLQILPDSTEIEYGIAFTQRFLRNMFTLIDTLTDGDGLSIKEFGFEDDAEYWDVYDFLEDEPQEEVCDDER
jgi:hypothetical protein